VHRPEEALDCFLRTRMDAIVLGRSLVSKRESGGKGEKDGVA